MAGTSIIDSSGRPMASAAPPSSPVRYNDSVTSAIMAGIGANGFAGMRPGMGAMERLFAPQLAAVAYLTSGMLQKVCDIPAADRTREWREWQAESEQVEAIEEEERRLQLQAKFKLGETLRNTGGGALVLITATSDHALPLEAESITKQGLLAANIVRRNELRPLDIDRELTSPTYGEPRMWQWGADKKIHPSRVIAFRGDPYPDETGVSEEDRFWGISRLVRVYREVMKSDNAQAWFADLVRKAKLLRIGIPGLTDYTATEGGQTRLDRRMAAIALGENGLNATIYDAGNGDKSPGESITDFQVTWAGIPAMMDAFDQRVAAVADIPFTRLMGRSPAGMNATGEHDANNYNAMVAAGQNLELRPCMEKLDPILLRSAGVEPDGLWWKFSPLYKPTPKEEADRLKTTAEGLKIIADLNAMPNEAFNAGVQGVIEENGWLPGSLPILAEMSEEERFGLNPDDDGSDPSALAAKGGDPDLAGGGGAAQPPARRAANDAATWLADATPRPLYVQRKLLNAADVIAWAKANGFESTLPGPDMHVTVLYSRAAVDPMLMGRDWSENEKGQIVVRPGGPRVIERLGEKAVVLRFASPDLEWRHKHMVEAGGSHDWPEYAPHVTLSYAVPEGVDLDALKPFNGELRFGPEIFEALDLDWKSKVGEE